MYVRRLGVALLLIFLQPAGAQEHHHDQPGPGERLGWVKFPTSCSAEVQPAFERGVALLHSFGYNLAQKQFQEIEAAQPTCAMAYWGEAMSLYHQLWDRPSAANLAEGATVVAKARAAGPNTTEEKGYVDAAAAFFSGDAKRTYGERSDAYSQALDKLRHEFPKDNEAAIFFALSLIASPQADRDDFALRKQAVTILNQVLKKEPDHPGVAHYLIHACDNPEMAREGLPAARRYAQIAPASAHALHMPSHIFTRLGMWPDDIHSNLASVAAAEKQDRAQDRVHAMDFLEYAYLQVGQNGKAKAIEEEALAIPGSAFKGEMADYGYRIRVHFPALYHLETRDWKAAQAVTLPPEAPPDFRANAYWAQAAAAGHLHDPAAASTAVKGYDAALEEVKKTSYAYVAESMVNDRDEAHAWLAFAEGKEPEATRLLNSVADKQDTTGKGEVELPAREMLADMLLETGHAEEALVQFEQSLKTDPNRFNALYGAARAAEAAHKPEVAASYFQHLLVSCPEGDRPELEAAKNYMKGVQSANNSGH